MLEASKQVYTSLLQPSFDLMLMLRVRKSQRGVAKSYTAYKTAQLEL